MIKRCECKHEDQDKIHGKGNRVHNERTEGSVRKGKGYRCTVCGKETT
jgi:hypothetical protein